MPRLVSPDAKYKESYIDAVKDRLATAQHSESLQAQMDNFTDYLKYLQKLTIGHGNKGSVPQSTYWLVNKKQYLGEIQIRHLPSGKIPNHIYYDIAPRERAKGYGKLILKLGLEKAKELGLKKVVLVCNQHNVASSKIIEANGGVLRESVTAGNEMTKVYEISLE